MPQSVNLRRLVRDRVTVGRLRVARRSQARSLPEPLASERLVPVVRGSLDAAINVLASCPRREGPAKRTSGVGSTRVCVTGGESAAIGPVAECRREATSRKVLV